MSGKTGSAVMLFLLVISTLTLAFRIQSVKADDGTIYINADGSMGLIKGNVVTNVTSFEAIRWQEKTFYAAGRYWLFYIDGDYPSESTFPSSTVYYTTSRDGVSWASPISLALGNPENSGENVEAFLSNSGYLQAFYRSDNELYYRMGTPESDGSITWATPSWQLIFNANSGEGSGTCDFYATTDSNNYPWVSWGYVQEPIRLLTPSDTKMYVWKDAFNNGTWQTAPGFPNNVGTDNYTNDFMVPLSNGKIYAMYFLDDPPLTGQIYGELWNGTAWGPQETCTTSQVNEQYFYGNESWSRTAIADSSDTIYLAFVSASLNLVFVERTIGGGWGNETIVQSNCGDYSSPSFNSYNGQMRLFWINSSTTICYKEYVNGLWDANPTVVVNETNSQIAVGTTAFGTDDGRLNAFTMTLGGEIGLLWVNNQTATDTGQIMFGLFQPQTTPIYIQADGSIQPPTAPISSVDNVTYTLTDNITANVASNSSAIIVQRDNITLDGAGHTLQGNGSGTGIDLSGTVNVTVKNAQISVFYVGVFLNSSSKSNVFGNNVTNNVIGVWLLDSSNSSILENIFINNGMVVTSSFGNVVDGNFVNGKPLAYLEGASGNIVNNAGQVIIVDSTGIQIQNLDLSNATLGVELWASNDSTVSQNNVSNNLYDGLALVNCSSNSISENNITNNVEGLEIGDSSNNTISGNNIVATEGEDLFLLVGSSDNVICHNNMYGNSSQVFSRAGSINTWDNDYPSGGNYWSAYNGTDLKSGPYQNVTGSDGIGDVPYVIDANNTDDYPLMGVFSTFNVAAGVDVQVVSNSTVSGFQFNGTAILFNVSGVNGTTGFCNVRVPTALLNGTLTVFVNGTQVQYSLLPISNGTQIYLYFTYGHSTEQVTIMPEFPDSLILAMFMSATLLAIAIHKKKHNRS